jgi:hypothetical protein
VLEEIDDFYSYDEAPTAIIKIPVNDAIIAIMFGRVISSARISRERIATANGEVEMITVPIDKGSLLNTYVRLMKARFPTIHRIAKGL